MGDGREIFIETINRNQAQPFSLKFHFILMYIGRWPVNSFFFLLLGFWNQVKHFDRKTHSRRGKYRKIIVFNYTLDYIYLFANKYMIVQIFTVMQVSFIDEFDIFFVLFDFEMKKKTWWVWTYNFCARIDLQTKLRLFFLLISVLFVMKR